MNPQILYKENPNLDKRTVTTVQGDTEYRHNVRNIKGKYYTMNRDAFFIEEKNTWYRLSDKIIFNHSTSKWVLKDGEGANLINGLAKFENGNPVIGYFSYDAYNNVMAYVPGYGGIIQAMNETIFKNMDYVENVSSGIWYPTSQITARKAATPANEVDHTRQGYNIEDNKAEYATKVKLYNEYTPKLSKDTVMYGKMLGDLTYGIELECSVGYMPKHLQNRTGVVICRDGSLNDENGRPGPEFVTISLTGAKGLHTIKEISEALSPRTAINNKCSLHIHTGNLPTSRLYLVSLFRLCLKIQNELFQMFPLYKANPEGVKQKNYNQKLPSLDLHPAGRGLNKEQFDNYIDESYKTIFHWLTDGYNPDEVFNRTRRQHPQSQKWNRTKRYFWMNMMNVIFSERNTIEWRLHTPTVNDQRITNWLFICNAIARYAATHANEILLSRGAITVKKVLNYYENFGKQGEFLSQYLNAYVEERKEAFYKDYEKGDKVSDWELKGDKTYKFKHGDVTKLF